MNAKRLEGRVAVVTGAAMGIGAGIAQELAREGASIVIGDIADDEAKKTAARISALGTRVEVMHCDVSQEGDVRRMLDGTAKQFGALHVLVNNAGIPMHKNVLEATVEEFDRVIAVNLRSVFLCTKYAAPYMAAAGGGSIINIASVHSVQNVGGTSPYAASKGGQATLTRTTAIELAKFKIRVNAICPGWVDTPAIKLIFIRAPDPAQMRREVEQRQLLGRIARPEEIGRAAVFLASDDSSYITGSLLFVDAGMTARLETYFE
jgi:NAD(P)-dependent dehydrogenase (short-subunit alcohol dehydrogenase family)